MSVARLTRYLAIAGIALLALAGASALLGMRINTTRSIPLGMYWVASTPITRDAYVMFCPPPVAVFAMAKERGYIGAGDCPGGYGYMMKRVLGVPGDLVSVRPDGVRINGEQLKWSVPLERDPGGRALPVYALERRLSTDELLLMSDHSARSFDARYFGPIARSQVSSVIRPLLTW